MTQLDAQYQGSPESAPLPLDLRINDEETLEDLLRRFVIPTVNHAPYSRTRPCGHFGRGRRCPSYGKPDWSVISPHRLDDDGMYRNLLPGDTKLDAKWWPMMA